MKGGRPLTGRPPFLMADYTSYRIRTMLECGHVVSHKVQYPFRYPPEWMHCDKCQCDVMAYAFETREWKAKCRNPNCKYVRWCGQSEESAKEVKRKHYNSKAHDMRISYDVNPQIFEIIRKGHKRRFQFRIPETPPRIRFPKKKGLDPEIPPF